MKTQFKYLFSNLLLVGLTGGMFALTGCPADEDCTTDTDCAEGEVCNTETSACEAPSGCSADTDCTTAGEQCFGADAETGAKGECRAPTDCSEASDPDAFCNAITAGQVCDTTAKTCGEPAPTSEYKYILIKDTSSGASACDSTPSAGGSDPGSDIMWALLYNDQDEVIGAGKAVTYNEGTSDGDANTYNKPNSVLTGMTPAIDADQCPAEVDGKRFRDDSVVSLGCGGSLFVEFIGNDSMSVLMEAGFSVGVGEYAAFCNQAGGDAMGSDRYEVYLCETDIDAAPTAADCTVKLAGPQGGIMPSATIAAE